MNALLQPHTQNWRHSHSWNVGPRCSFPPNLPNYLLSLGQEQRSKCCTLGVLSFQSCSEWVWHHSLPWQARPWGKERTNSSLTPRTWFTLALHQLSVPLHFSQNLCESDLWFLSGIWLAGYVSNKIKHGVYNGAAAIVDENSEVSSDRSERDRSLLVQSTLLKAMESGSALRTPEIP